MLSKNRQKTIRQMAMRKYRKEYGMFLAEGPKLVGELLKCMKPIYIAATREWTDSNRDAATLVDDIVTQDELSRASLQQTPQGVLALFPLPHHETDTSSIGTRDICLMLDGIQDPGNIGTIVRLADWFGIRQIICSNDTADIYSPKAIQATMGSICRVEIIYTDLPELLKNISPDVPVYGTLLDGDDVYDTNLSSNGIIIMGNEGNGISTEVRKYLTHGLLIPPYPISAITAESLNVGVATAIICAEFRRRIRQNSTPPASK
ncbi:MAG: RNA methyltransferase [Prevotella sp.]|nr:RNA methyltransferase [Prevotella sp.]